ncbi:hypothetical protein E2C01_070943 [Portunus trituberculatus]|uniref:Uncharacterized protein n=1 Tax=Portunus trituberculatus TaxID=210409 RepID=A0A5B7I4Y3_PORTR|nr:hypothetical protein [Portunus trituberculatus]
MRALGVVSERLRDRGVKIDNPHVRHPLARHNLHHYHAAPPSASLLFCISLASTTTYAWAPLRLQATRDPLKYNNSYVRVTTCKPATRQAPLIGRC